MVTEETNGNYQRKRIAQSDAIGRLTDVCEILASGDSVFGSVSGAPCSLDVSGNGFHTVYGYNLAGNLLSVTQPGVGQPGTASRTWTYDTLGRVVTESTPEAGLTTYLYHPQGVVGAGQVWTVQRPVPNNPTSLPASTVDKEIWYDELGRPYTIAYYYTGTTVQEPHTPAVFNVYDVAPNGGTQTSNL